MNKNILIYGFGKSGKSCFNYFIKNNNLKIYEDDNSAVPKNLKKYIIKKTKLISSLFDIIIV